MKKYTGPIKEVEVVEKTVLTTEQAHEFEAFKKLRNSLEDWAHDKSDPNATYSIIHELTFDEMARAYLIGYEIEPEQPKFKAGDYIFHERTGLITELTEQTADFVNVDYIEKENLRLATIEEVYWLAELGREKVGDFREGDVIFTIYDSIFKVGNSDFGSDDFVSATNAEALKPVGIYPAESFKPFPKEPGNAHHR